VSSLLAAESARLETMVRLFLVAVVLVAPAAFVVARRLLRGGGRVERGDGGSADDTSAADGSGSGPGPGSGSAAAPGRGVDPLARLIADIDDAARRVADGEVCLDVAAELADRLGAGGAAPSVERLVVDDAVRRNGLSATWDRDDGGTRLHLRSPRR